MLHNHVPPTFALCGLLALTAPRLPAQEPVHGALRGRATSVSGRPVTAASVRLLEVHREEPTHADGRFTFPHLRPGDYSVQIRAIGYRPETRRVTVPEADTVTVDFLLLESAVELQDIVVTGSLDSRRRDEVLSPTAVLGGAALDRRLSQTVGATLQRPTGPRPSPEFRRLLRIGRPAVPRVGKPARGREREPGLSHP
jgi:hypothetical protein